VRTEAAAFWSSALARAAEPSSSTDAGRPGARRFGSALCARDRGHAQRLWPVELRAQFSTSVGAVQACVVYVTPTGRLASVSSCGCAAQRQSCGLGRSVANGRHPQPSTIRLCCWRGLGSEVLTCFASCPDSSLQLQSREMAALPGLGDGERWRQWRPVIRCGRLVQLEPVGFVCIKRRDDNGLWFRSFKEQTCLHVSSQGMLGSFAWFTSPAHLVLPCRSKPSKFCRNCQSLLQVPAKLDLGGSGRA